MRSLSTLFSTIAVFLLAAVPALAATPTDDVYAPTDAKIQASSAGAGDPSSLPFTGFELALLIVAGLIVLATGLLVRRASRSD
jgi:hypothetical protein